jgi:hypothetical protein
MNVDDDQVSLTQTLATNLDHLQALLIELLVASQAWRDAGAPAGQTQARHYLSLARLCARTMEGLASRAPHQAEVAQVDGLNTWLERVAGDARERAIWQYLLETGQYRAVVHRLEGKLFPGRDRGRRRGMAQLTRRLAEQALQHKRAGVTWSRLLEVIIQDLQGKPDLDAEGQVLLTRLLDRQTVRHPNDNGAYLRLIVGRYKAELSLHSA